MTANNPRTPHIYQPEQVNYTVGTEFFDLFDDTDDYPRNLAETGVPINTCFDCVGYDYLDVTLKYTKVFYAAMIEHYDKRTAEQKEAIYNDIINKEYRYQQYYDIVEDHVVFLSESKNSYWIFYYDPDVSDCLIGRVEKSRISKEEFKSKYIKHLESKKHKESYCELPLNKYAFTWYREEKESE
ncbi:hypothetical protein SAMN04487895_10338 [Paenibacillus sophorae]|uniref:Uncharacterized protein n=1 Tax=Paenibacillus sophorae TaxID=1333845 RepID=A0A1H8JJT5_9BACL|nr:hypothetical protein [Paenibacillus sophorae]QWU13375.1 hypothetical protein KP014_15345 [Paenibacillus sophorae]SEN80546.1 hypothetical protein SAMN04487895_10338 [Paenibacillus sophorae]